jgi:hypothetical protein
MPNKKPQQQKTVNFGVTMLPQIFKKLEKMRGPLPRAWVIENAVMFYLNEVEKGRFTILQDFSTVTSPESPTEQSSSSSFVKDNSPQNPVPVKEEDAVPVS